MSALRLAIALSAALGLFLSAGTASAEDCTYTDLLEQFQVTADCSGLKDHTNIGNEQKRMWLAGDWGQLNIIEVPQPYKQDAGHIDLIMSNLGRVYSERRSPGGVTTTTVAGQDARVITEHKMRNSTRSWVFHWEGRNLIVRAVAYNGSVKARSTLLDTMGDAVIGSFTAYTAPVTADLEEPAPRVRDRKTDERSAAEAVKSDQALEGADAADAEPEPAADAEPAACAKCGDGECTCEHEGGHAADHECSGPSCDHAAHAEAATPAPAPAVEPGSKGEPAE